MPDFKKDHVFIFITHKPNPAKRKTFFSTSRRHAGLKNRDASDRRTVPYLQDGIERSGLWKDYRRGERYGLTKALHPDLSARICERTSREKTI